MTAIPSLEALRTLVRWRGFQESQGANGYREANAQVSRCQGQIDSARSRLQDVDQHRANMLGAGVLDIGMLHIVDALEERVQCALIGHAQTLQAAEAARLSAQETYVAARTRSQVAQNRQMRIERGEAEKLEKAQFDHMADLVAGTRECMW